jgi:hypothetical protein
VLCACDFLSYIRSHTRGCVLTQGTFLASALAVGAADAVVTIAFTGLRRTIFAVVAVGPVVTSPSVPTVTTGPTAIFGVSCNSSRSYLPSVSSVRRALYRRYRRYRRCFSASSGLFRLKSCVGCVGGSSPVPTLPTQISECLRSFYAQILRQCNPVHTVATVAISRGLCTPSASALLQAYKACRCALVFGGRYPLPTSHLSSTLAI